MKFSVDFEDETEFSHSKLFTVKLNRNIQTSPIARSNAVKSLNTDLNDASMDGTIMDSPQLFSIKPKRIIRQIQSSPIRANRDQVCDELTQKFKQLLSESHKIKQSVQNDTRSKLQKLHQQKQQETILLQNQQNTEIGNGLVDFEADLQKRKQLIDKADRIIQLKKKEEEERQKQILQKQEEEKRQKEAMLKQKQQEEEQRKLAEIQKQQELEQKEKIKLQQDQQKQELKSTLSPSNDLHYYANTQKLELYQKCLEKVKFVKENCKKTIDQNKEMSNEARRYRMQITVKTGAITNVKPQLIKFYSELKAMFDKAKQISSDMLYPFLLSTYAKAVVNQAINEVSINVNKAFPIANLTMMLIQSHPELQDYILGRMFKKCIYIVPAYVKRKTNETDDELRLRMGLKKSGDKWESEEHYWERMYGIIALYSALCIADVTQFGLQNQENQLKLADAWSFIARLLNLTPRKITPTVVFTFLKIAGNSLIHTYKQQAHKLLDFIRLDYINRIKSEGTQASKARLEIMMEEYVKTKKFPELEGQTIRLYVEQ